MQRIRNVFPAAAFTGYDGEMIIPNFPLTGRYNRRYTKILFKLFPGSSYHEPHIYVPSDLDLASTHSSHLDFLTEPEMMARGWKRVCVKMNWRPSYCLLDAVHLAMDFLYNLRG